jgi:hypothetical protein
MWTALASLWLLAPPQDPWEDHQDPYGTFTLSRPQEWEVRQPRPGEVEVRGSETTWVRISTLATLPEEGATAKEEVVSFIGTLAAGYKSRGFAELSLRPDRAVWSYTIPESMLQGLVAVEVNGILHYGVAYQAPEAEWRKCTETFRRIVSSFRAGEFRIPEWIHGGARDPLPMPKYRRADYRWSPDGTLCAEVPDGWESRGEKQRLEISRGDGPARMVWQLSERTGDPKPPEELVAAALGLESIRASQMPAQNVTKARLFPRPKKAEPPAMDPDPDADVPYETFNRLSFTFQETGGRTMRGYALVHVTWTKKNPQPYHVEVLVFLSSRDTFAEDAEILQKIATSLYKKVGGLGYDWEGTYARRDIAWLAKHPDEEEGP